MKKQKRYTEEDIAFIRRWYRRKTLEQIARHCRHSVHSIRWKIKDLGILQHVDRWTDDELARLRALHGTMPVEDIAHLLGRTVYATKNKVWRLKLDASRKVGYSSRGQKIHFSNGCRIYWSPQMAADLTRLFPTTKNADLAEILGVSVRSVIRKARELGVSKTPGFMRQTNRDAIRHMAFKNKIHRNEGMIKPGEHKSPATEFKKKAI